ncbi:MAG: protein kinase [Myxococcales bacterium]|nr:protein kinase [Myxococcales bacterium]
MPLHPPTGPHPPMPLHPPTGPHPPLPAPDPAPSDSMVGAAVIDPGSSAIQPVTRLATSPSLRTLPSVVPFRAPVRGDMIRNGSVGVYFMGEYIGGGSYGDVYECTDEWANPLVAKVLKPAMSFEEVRRQWESEVNNLSRMRHPNITYIYDAFFYDNAFYIIVEKCLYSLDRVLSRIDESWLPHIARDVLQALAFIHRHGHVHKDVHPGNVFVSLTSDVMDNEHGPRVSFKLGDLGITRVETDIRMVGTIMAPWMLPPEAMDPASFGTVGRPTDVYHAGLLLLSVLRRQVPQFNEAEILAGVPQQVAQSLHSPYASALANALRPRVMHRTQTPLEFWREIQAALQYVGSASG